MCDCCDDPDAEYDRPVRAAILSPEEYQAFTTALNNREALLRGVMAQADSGTDDYQPTQYTNARVELDALHRARAATGLTAEGN